MAIGTLLLVWERCSSLAGGLIQKYLVDDVMIGGNFGSFPNIVVDK
ncbi:hypothetical protein ACFQ88_04240 [Paenibacillus sp. NPDC056579]